MDTLLRWRIARSLMLNKKFAQHIEKGGKALDIMFKMFPKASLPMMKIQFDRWEQNSPSRYLRAFRSLATATNQYRKMYLKLWRVKSAILNASDTQREAVHKILATTLTYGNKLAEKRNLAWRRLRAPVSQSRACRYLQSTLNSCIRRLLLAGFRRTQMITDTAHVGKVC